MAEILHTVVENRSRFPIDFVWENAQDLEHVAILHSKTNRSFELLYAGKAGTEDFPGKQYDVLSYRSVRKLFCFGFQACGFRRIIRQYQLQQIEYIPLLRLTVVLNSVLRPSGDPDFPTRMIDEVILTGPRWMRMFKTGMEKSLKRHTAIQCQEDEPFRARRQLLEQKGIRLPYRLFFASSLETCAKRFTQSPVENG